MVGRLNCFKKMFRWDMVNTLNQKERRFVCNLNSYYLQCNYRSDIDLNMADRSSFQVRSIVHLNREHMSR